jgi:hypothetical protein
MDVDTTNEDGYTRVDVSFTPVIPLGWVSLDVRGDKIIDVRAYPSDFELERRTSNHIEFGSSEIDQGQTCEFSILVEDPDEVSVWLDSSFGWVEETPSNTITLPVAELGSVTAEADVPVKWEHRPAQPQYVQSITIEIEEKKGFDTGGGTYPSIMGAHKGTIKPAYSIAVTKMYTYPCEGTSGHAEYVRIYGHGLNESATWNGYQSGDYQYITFPQQFTMIAGQTYSYAIKTGSYPQIIHRHSFNTTDGEITCTSFVDANGKWYNDWIPAMRLE